LPVSEGQEAIQNNVSADIPFLYLKTADFGLIFCCFENEITIFYLIIACYSGKRTHKIDFAKNARSDRENAIFNFSLL